MKPLGNIFLMTLGLWLLTASAAGQDKKLKDEDIAKRLVGKWTYEKTEPDNFIKMELTADKDGNFTFSKETFIDREDFKQSSYNESSGTLKVANGIVQLHKQKMPVIDIDANTLTTAFSNAGKFQVWKKVKD